MDDLIAFLRARLDEQEARVRALPEGPWEWKTTDNGLDPISDSLAGPSGEALIASNDAESYSSWITRHEAFDAYLQDIQPAQVLAEVDAKRRRLDQIAEAIAAGHDSYDLAAILLPLEALPYADHPDYQDTWQP